MKIELTGPSRRSSRLRVRFVEESDRRTLPPEVTAREFDGKRHDLLRLHRENELILGLGSASSIDAGVLRSAGSVAISQLKKCGIPEADVDLGAWARFAGAFVEGAVLADFRFEDFRPEKSPNIRRLRIECAEPSAIRGAIKRAQILAEAVNDARRINNQPGNVIHPESLAAEAKKLGRAGRLKVRVLDEQALARGGFEGLLAVGRGSQRPPRLIVIEYRGFRRPQPPIALVGKAITFDTGGLSIKPAASMPEMIFDKSGGTTVLGAMAALAALKIPRRVVGLIAAAENMPSSTAYRPGDIIRMYDGTAVEVVNTDAEGRMVLADAIAYARKTFKPEAVIDLATLTGACGVALGALTAGLWATSPSLETKLLEASRETGEPLWPMPLTEEFDDEIKSDVAVIKNAGGRLGAASTAAAFLKKFAGDTPWAHLDIAFAAALEKPRHGLPAGATGFGLRTLVTLIERWP